MTKAPLQLNQRETDIAKVLVDIREAWDAFPEFATPLRREQWTRDYLKPVMDKIDALFKRYTEIQPDKLRGLRNDS